MRALALGLLAALTLAAATAQEAGKSEDPCAFDWPLAREQAWFSAENLPTLASGASLPAEPPAAILILKPSETAGLPQPPTRPAKPGSFAGFLRVPASDSKTAVQVTLSDEGWIDVATEEGGLLASTAHTGRRSCPGLRKSLHFETGGKPLIVEVSNASTDSMRIAVAPAEW